MELIIWLFLTTLVSAQHLEQHPAPAGAQTTNEILQKVAAVHGQAGPFAVAGHRMGERALRELDAHHGEFSLNVTHESPAEMQWSCIADGLQASTGVSVGKLNLRHRVVPQNRMRSIVRDRDGGKEIILKLKPEFIRRFLNTQMEKLPEAGKEVMALNDDEIFEVVIPKKK